VTLETDRKATYPGSIRRVLGPKTRLCRIDSRLERSYRNPLFPINHTLAMLRDGMSRLVRRTWAASKRARRLELHFWVWLAYRNYVRDITNQARGTTPAMEIGVEDAPFKPGELLRRRLVFSA
jgi:hypothetical protein